MEPIMQFWEEHGVMVLATLWLVLSAVINSLLRTRTPEGWVELGMNYPRLAAVIKFLRAIGVDPVKAVKAIAQLISGKAEKSKEVLPEKAKLAVDVAEKLAGDKLKEKDEP